MKRLKPAKKYEIYLLAPQNRPSKFHGISKRFGNFSNFHGIKTTAWLSLFPLAVENILIDFSGHPNTHICMHICQLIVIIII